MENKIVNANYKKEEEWKRKIQTKSFYIQYYN